MKKDNLDLFVEQLLSELESEDIEDVNAEKDDELLQKATDSIRKFKRELEDKAQYDDELRAEKLFTHTFERELEDPENIKQALFRLKQGGKDVDSIVEDPYEIYKQVKKKIKDNISSSVLTMKAKKDQQPEKAKKSKPINYIGPNPIPDNTPKDVKYNLPITLQADNGDTYVIVPNDQMKDIYDQISTYHYQNGITPQRGMNRRNRFILQYGGANAKDTDSVVVDTVRNAKMLSYGDYRKSFAFQKLLGKQLAQFYIDKNIKPEDQPLEPVNATMQKNDEAHHMLLHNQDFIRAMTSLTGQEREEYLKTAMKQARKQLNAKDKELYPAAASVPRADDINIDRINKIYNYKNNLELFKNKFSTLNDQDKELFNTIQKVVTEPKINFVHPGTVRNWPTKMSPRDLMLLYDNFKELAATSNNAKEISDNWDRLKNNNLSYHESALIELLFPDSETLSEMEIIPYNHKILFDIIRNSGVHFTPINDDGSNNFVGLCNLRLWEDHGDEIPVKDRTNTEIQQDWQALTEKYWLDYYVPLVVDWLKGKGYLEPSLDVNVPEVVDKLKTEFRDVFTFANYLDFKERKEAIYKAITGQDFKQMAKVSNLSKYNQQNKESRYDEMIIKVIKEQIGD